MHKHAHMELNYRWLDASNMEDVSSELCLCSCFFVLCRISSCVPSCQAEGCLSLWTKVMVACEWRAESASTRSLCSYTQHRDTTYQHEPTNDFICWFRILKYTNVRFSWGWCVSFTHTWWTAVFPVGDGLKCLRLLRLTLNFWPLLNGKTGIPVGWCVWKMLGPELRFMLNPVWLWNKCNYSLTFSFSFPVIPGSLNMLSVTAFVLFFIFYHLHVSNQHSD